MPTGEQLLRRGFKKLWRPFGVESWAYDTSRVGHLTPLLTWSNTLSGDWLTAESSLPVLMYGRNTRWLEVNEIQPALDRLGRCVESMSEMQFDAKTALVGRVDYVQNFHVGERNVKKYISAVSQLSLPRYTRHVYGTTVMFGNKSKQILLYDKYAEVCSREFDSNWQQEAWGVLRLEVRFRKGACDRLRKKHGRASREASELLMGDIALKELTLAIKELGLNEGVAERNQRIDHLLEHYGDTALTRRVAGFLPFYDRFGNDFWREEYGGYSRSMYYDHLRKLKTAGALLCSDIELPPLTFAESDFKFS